MCIGLVLIYEVICALPCGTLSLDIFLDRPMPADENPSPWTISPGQCHESLADTKPRENIIKYFLRNLSAADLSQG